MRSYETIVVIKPDLPDEEVGKIYQNIKNYLEKNNCQLIKEENWGKRKLAYEIKKYKEGLYYYIKYNASNYNIPSGLEKSFNLNENILRYISVKLEDKKAMKIDKEVDDTSTAREETDQYKEGPSSTDKEKTESEG